jgi:hypothetical protein
MPDDCFDYSGGGGFMTELVNERRFILEGSAQSDPDIRCLEVAVGHHPTTATIIVRTMPITCRDGMIIHGQEIPLTAEAAAYVTKLHRGPYYP